jgi:membrane-associated protease RseP (regulator of RpoE activity)
MKNTLHVLVASAALAAFAAPSIAQNAEPVLPRCGPGTSFGVTAYRVAQFSSHGADSSRVAYSFGAEPVVIQVDSVSRVRAGDVIVAVNRYPITTRAGADLFAYPSGDVTLTVRRNGANLDFGYAFRVGPCWERPGTGTLYSLLERTNRAAVLADTAAGGGRGGRGVGGTSGGGRGGGRGGRGGGGTVAAGSAGGAATGVVAGADTAANRLYGQLLYARSGTTPFSTTTSSVPVANFGLALVCRPNCTRARSADSTSYWRFTAYPVVARLGVPEDGLAGKAGIREGDILISVNGHSPLSEEGALLLERAGTLLSLSLEFSRAGARNTYTLRR